MTAPAIFKHYTFHLVGGEAIEVDCDPNDVAWDGDYLAFDLPLGRMVVIARRHVTYTQVRDV